MPVGCPLGILTHVCDDRNSQERRLPICQFHSDPGFQLVTLPVSPRDELAGGGESAGENSGRLALEILQAELHVALKRVFLQLATGTTAQGLTCHCASVCFAAVFPKDKGLSLRAFSI